LLASATVSDSDLHQGSYYFHTLSSPVTLSANTEYLIGALVGGPNVGFLDGYYETPPTSPFSAGPDFTIVENAYTFGSSLSAPVLDGTGELGRWGPASALVDLVPEPSSMAIALFGIGSACVVAGVRQVRQRPGPAPSSRGA
jgi:hypothetical protein